jgi:hypothetical protein
MKYLKLFEAFESKIMSKTLKYLSKDSKDRFFNMMKAYCEKYDFPFSKLNDDFFEYLPYSAALKKYISVGDIVEDCKTKSEDVLDKKIAVVGDVCTKGKLKRTWGKGTREVECPTCNGTGKIKVGVKADAPEDYELTKIWLDDTGDIVSITYTDGKSVGGSVAVSTSVELKMENFKQGERITRLNQLKNMEYIYVKRGSDEAVGYCLIEGARYYLISNNKELEDTSRDIQPRTDWKKYAKYSWILRHEGSNYYNEIYRMESIYKDNSVNHFAYNKVTAKAKSGWYVKKETAVGFEDLKQAKFAIIFDSGKAKQTQYEKVSDKVAKRVDYKFGAAAFEKPEDIKTQNLDRWITKLASKNVGGKLSDLGSLDTYIFRILGGKNILLKLLTDGTSNLEKVIDTFFTMLEGVGPDLDSINIDSMNDLFLKLFAKLREKGENHIIAKLNEKLISLVGDVSNDQVKRLEALKTIYKDNLSIFDENGLAKFSFTDVESHNESLLLEASDIDELRIWEAEFSRLRVYLIEKDRRRLYRDIVDLFEETFDYIMDECDYSKRRTKIMAIKHIFEEYEDAIYDTGFRIGRGEKEKTKTPTATKAKRGDDKTKPTRELLYSLFTKSFKENEKVNNEIKAFMDHTTIKWNDKLVLKKALEVSNLIYEKLKSFGKVATLSDAELILQKIKSIESIFKSSRWEFNKLGYKDVKSYAKKLDDAQKDKVISSLDELSKLIEKI